VGRRVEYEGGAWSIGSCNPYRPPHTLSAHEAAQRAHEVRERYLPFAEARAAEGRKWYAQIAAWYRAELDELDARAAHTPPQTHHKGRGGARGKQTPVLARRLPTRAS